MVFARLQWRVGPFHLHVFGYIRGMSNLTLSTQANQRPTVVVFLDLEKAFELVSPHAILKVLSSKGVRGRQLVWLRDYLHHRHARVKYQGRESRFQELENGTPQGGILSPFLFNLLMKQLAALHFPEDTFLLSYANDLALVFTGRRIEHRRKQQAHDAIRGKCKKLWLKISAGKTRAMMVKAANPAWQLHVQRV